jgi:CheY-like chemotaxis protein
MAQSSTAVTGQEMVPRRGAILVIEDREDVRQGLSQLLELHGFLVADVRDGESALEHLGMDPGGVALILLDLLLPGRVSGREFRSCQFAVPELAGIPTVVITASELDTNERARLRPDGWLEKPFKFDDLLELVRRYVIPQVPPALDWD